MLKKFLVLSAVFAGVCLAGCGDKKKRENVEEVKTERVSTVPWNAPASWEGGGQLGSALSGSQ